MDSEIDFMQLAIDEAERSPPADGQGDKKPRPKVGAVVVKDGRVLKTAFRGETGAGDHAEYGVLEGKLRNISVAGATVYTTLEPCTVPRTEGQPCCEWLIERKVARVVIGMLDPNQAICGRGLRRLREANIVTDMFPSELMSKVEEQNRSFTRSQRAISNQLNKVSHGVQLAGLTRFVPSREHYGMLRADAATIDKYISLARNTLTIVGINLMTGVTFDDIRSTLVQRLSGKDPLRSATVSLSNPRNQPLMETIAPVVNMSAQDLATGIELTLGQLCEVRRTLPDDAGKKMAIRVHESLPFGSAVMIDHREPSGRVQIETKPYKAGFNKSFALEFRPPSTSGLYAAICKGYDQLLEDGHDWQDGGSNA